MMFPKPKRVEDLGAIEAAWRRDNGRCLMCGDPVRQTSVHHIVSRGAGGHDKLENLITLCRKHHLGDVHGGKYTIGQLRALLSVRYGYSYEAA